MSQIEITIDPSVRDLISEHTTSKFPIHDSAIELAVRSAASLADCTDCRIGVRVTNDPSIHQINRQFLSHDYPTDVISFPYELAPPVVEGELVVSLDTAIASAAEAGWTVAEELLLYVVHGTLHLVGYDDTSTELSREMRAAEAEAMRRLTHPLSPL